jgi:hypothetical protein
LENGVGVTLHIEGKLLGEEEYNALVCSVRDFALRHHWPTEEICDAQRSLQRVRNEQDWDYEGLTRGIVIHPHESAEPLRFEFDETLYIQEFCKTQFAGPEVHISIIELIRTLQPLFETLTVEDEGEYWNTMDPSLLSGHMRSVDEQIARLIAEKPSRQAAVRLPSQRIVDVID